MKKITEQKFLENIESALEQAATMRDSFMIETKNGNVALVSEKEWKSYMNIIEVCMDSMKIIRSQRNEPF